MTKSPHNWIIGKTQISKLMVQHDQIWYNILSWTSWLNLHIIKEALGGQCVTKVYWVKLQVEASHRCFSSFLIFWGKMFCTVSFLRHANGHLRVVENESYKIHRNVINCASESKLMLQPFKQVNSEGKCDEIGKKLFNLTFNTKFSLNKYVAFLFFNFWPSCSTLSHGWFVNLK